MSASAASKHVDPQLLTPAVEPGLLVTRPKKRKSATSELIPWHKELLQGSERLRDIRWLPKLSDLMCLFFGVAIVGVVKDPMSPVDIVLFQLF